MKKIRVALASAVLGVGLLAPTAAPAHAAYNDAKIHNKAASDRNLWVCKDWSGAIASGKRRSNPRAYRDARDAR